ncbi:hypothetical protein [Paraburkholderia fungorum]|jgi:hypothetical protein|uniref:Uncharacterized protein n=1 Tax=Paraburkholderia fungorum TaxID=134537 RepID=A0AAJ3VUI7_9BURK|nr:hypothetical protein [Paraburkholderia fungorum]KFX61044.1 hypothetical protein KBK24_0134745 [Burkholderia sp. K24]AJZ59975.1 hypothetical protein OI25_3640 [Paraburkholderia fungorum]MBB4513974.1 hypothetical protein [Paraburkholderia fungorum]MBB5543495.1 hypothetical protein [Paraburkholderia fungorum]MBB6202484.1 hypothetical protein [Paraburkholderia fungorum]
MEICDGCANIDGRPVGVEGHEGITLIGVAECNGALALEHYRCDKCRAIIARRFVGQCDERVWSVIEAAR